MYFFSNSPVRWRLTKVVCVMKLCQRVDFLLTPSMPGASPTSCRWPATHLASTAITNEHQLEGRLLLFRHCKGRVLMFGSILGAQSLMV